MEKTAQNFEYKIDNNGVVITRYIGESNTIIVPKFIKVNEARIPVYKIENFAFDEPSDEPIEKLELPEGLTTIDGNIIGTRCLNNGLIVPSTVKSINLKYLEAPFVYIRKNECIDKYNCLSTSGIEFFEDSYDSIVAKSGSVDDLTGLHFDIDIDNIIKIDDKFYLVDNGEAKLISILMNSNEKRIVVDNFVNVNGDEIPVTKIELTNKYLQDISLIIPDNVVSIEETQCTSISPSSFVFSKTSNVKFLPTYYTKEIKGFKNILPKSIEYLNTINFNMNMYLEDDNREFKLISLSSKIEDNIKKLVLPNSLKYIYLYINKLPNKIEFENGSEPLLFSLNYQDNTQLQYHNDYNFNYNINDNGCYIGSENNPFLVYMRPLYFATPYIQLVDGTTCVEEFAFSNCDALQLIKLPSSIKGFCPSSLNVQIENYSKKILLATTKLGYFSRDKDQKCEETKIISSDTFYNLISDRKGWIYND